jgi:hypothetical protein
MGMRSKLSLQRTRAFLDNAGNDPRVALGGLVYVVGIIGAANMALIYWIKTLF